MSNHLRNVENIVLHNKRLSWGTVCIFTTYGYILAVNYFMLDLIGFERTCDFLHIYQNEPIFKVCI